MLDAIEHERENERWRAIFEIEQRRDDHRAGTIAAMILNVNRGDKDDKLWESADFFPSLRREAVPEAEAVEMSTEETVAHLRAGFRLFLPPS